MKKVFITLIGLLVLTPLAYNQTSIPKAQSLFIYNFSRMIEWPANYRTGDFIIGILGTDEVTVELETYTKGKKVGAQNIQVLQYKTPAEIRQCHILFVPFGKTKQLGEIIAALNGKHILIITEKSGALNEGSAINFLLLDDKMKFEIKPENASKYGLKLSAKIQELANSSM